MEFGEKFKVILKEKKVTQAKFADDCNLHKGYVSRILNGESPSADFIMKAVGYFPDINLYHLFFDGQERSVTNEPDSDYKKEGNPIEIIDNIEVQLKKLKSLVTQK